MEKLSHEQIYSKTMIFTILKAAMPVAQLIASLVAMKIIVSIGGGTLNIVGMLIWLVITIVIAFLIDFFVGYKFRAGHVAVVTDAVSVGMFADDMRGMANEMVQFRFPTCNDYLAYRLNVMSALNQLQKKVNTFAERKMSTPVLGQLISLAQVFIGMALSFTYDLILAYTFWRDGKPLYTSAADAAAIYYYSWKRIVDNVLYLAIMIIAVMVITFIGVFAFTAPLFTNSFGGSVLAGGCSSIACGVFVCRTVKVFFESTYMIRSMIPFFDEAKYAEITDEEYGIVCRESNNFRKLYAKAASEPKEAPVAVPSDAQGGRGY